MGEQTFNSEDFAKDFVKLREQFTQKNQKQFKLTVAWGKPKCGKTFWSLDLAMHIALGEDFHGRKVTQGNVVYCTLEGKSDIAKRIEAYRQYKLNRRTPDFSLMLTPLQMIAEHES